MSIACEIEVVDFGTLKDGGLFGPDVRRQE
jgi:hypothetical protein